MSLSFLLAAGCAAPAPASDSRGTSGDPPGAGSSSAAPASLTPLGTQKWTKQPISVGTWLVTSLAGSASGLTMKVNVWLPPQYYDPAYAGKRFPVLMVFPGGAGVSGAAWMGEGQPQLVAREAAAGRVTPFVFVEPQMQVSYAKDTECTDLAGEPRVGTFFEEDVPALIKSSFNVLSERSAWGISGVSSGAYCAARLLFHRPEVFSVGATLDGYFFIDSPLPGAKTAEGKATSPILMAAANPPNVLLRNWYGTVGADGTVSKARNDAMAKAVRPPTVFESRVSQGGTHTWASFRTVMPEVFAFFTEKLDKPR